MEPAPYPERLRRRIAEAERPSPGVLPPPGFAQPIPDPSFRVLAGQDIADLIGER